MSSIGQTMSIPKTPHITLGDFGSRKKMNPLLAIACASLGTGPIESVPMPIPPPMPCQSEMYVECPKRFEDEDPELAELLGWWGTLDRREQKQLWNQPTVNETPKVGVNDPCPCNSGKKYKKCCKGK